MSDPADPLGLHPGTAWPSPDGNSIRTASGGNFCMK